MDITNIYFATLPILATENLIMGLTLLMLQGKSQVMIYRHQVGFRFLAFAMLMIAVINFLELFPKEVDTYSTLSTVIPAASIQLFLLLYAYVSMLNSNYATFRRIVVELLLILVFTIPPLFINVGEYPELFYTLFYTSIGFYLVKYIVSIRIFSKQYQRASQNLKNFYSDDNVLIIKWIKNTFYMILVIGAVSVIIPLTNYLVLIVYQILLFVTYFYLFWKVIGYTTIAKESVVFAEPIAVQEQTNQENEKIEDVLKLSNSNEVKLDEEKLKRAILFEKWIAERRYAQVGITIDDVATYFRTNRTTVSIYINSELHFNFYEWISEIRINEAKKQLIENPTLPIAEIATYVGIEDRSNFDKTFKRLTGLSPAAYRIEQAKIKVKS